MGAKLIFKQLFLFSSTEKKARKIEFSPGKTIITSSKVDGTDRGKSVVLKSLYHTMGADCFFEDKWDDKSKTYILLFEIDGIEFYIYRFNRLFKVFDSNKNLLFSVVSRHQLAEELNELFHFAVKLPPRNANEVESISKLEIAPPAYNYILYFVDQDKQNGSQFSSFQKLGEYTDFKENVIYYHLGAFNDDYYDLIQQLGQVNSELKRFAKDQEMLQLMMDKIYESIKFTSYSKDIEHLRADVERTKSEYNKIAHMLSNIRQKLVVLRNDKVDLEEQLTALHLLNQKNEKQIISINNHICPLCKSHLQDTLDLRIKRYGTSDDIILLSGDMQYSIGVIDRKIIQLESEYSSWLARLEEYETSINIKSAEINDVLRHKGYVDIKEQVSDDLRAVQKAITSNETLLKEVKANLRKYSAAKKKINERYYTLMLQDKNYFGLEGIDAKSLESVTRTVSAGGSNNPISTIIWYVNLIRLKSEFNPDAICFPVVFDSPNNAETDETKKNQIYKYICEHISENQLIVSGIGFDQKINDVHFDKTIILTNKKYELLCEEDYEKYVDLLRELNSK